MTTDQARPRRECWLPGGPHAGGEIGSSRAFATILAALILAAALAARLVPLGRYVTPDEPAWVHRSIMFADAVVARDWAGIPSTGHPGVTTMWLGTAAIAARDAVDPAGSAIHLNWLRRMAWLSPDNAEAFSHLAFFLPWCRVAVAVTTVVGLAVIYSLVVRLFGVGSALVTLGLLAFDAFMVGHSGLLHTDALLATFTGISVLGLLVAARSGSRMWMWAGASGVAGGLAIGTKTLSIALAAYAIAVLGIAWLSGRMRFHTAAGLAATWAASCGLTFWGIYPAMWSSPVTVLRDLLGAPAFQSTTALTPTFFAGKVALTHGPEFYAVALPLRLSPVVLAGLVLGIAVIRKRDGPRREMALLWLFAVGYVGMLALSPKKFDRYLLPVVIPLSTVAGVGLVHMMAARLRSQPSASGGPDRSRCAAPLLLATPLLLQVALLIPFATYPLTYFNPVLGGPWAARTLLDVDWGEGMGAAARWLNDQPRAGELTAAAASIPSFASIYVGRTVPLAQASQADYIVASATGGFGSEPIHIARTGFLAGAAIFPNRAHAEQAAFLASRASPNDVVFSDADTPLSRDYSGPGTIYSLAGMPDRASAIALVAGLAAEADSLWLVRHNGASPVAADIAHHALDAAGTPLSIARVGSATVSQYSVTDHAVRDAEPHLLAFGDQLRLLEAQLPDEPVRGSFPVYLRWQAVLPTDATVYASIYLRDQDGHLWSEVGQPIVNDHTFPTTEWSPAEWTDSEMRVGTPELLAPGEFAILLTLTDGLGGQLGVWDSSGRFRGVRARLGSVIVAPPAEVGGSQPCDQGWRLVGGPFHACVQAPSPDKVLSGDAFEVGITWSAPVQPDVDFSLRLGLVETSGAVAYEQINSLSTHPTSRWRRGDTYEARYEVRTDPCLPAGTYSLTLDLMDPGGPVGWEQRNRRYTVEIMGRDRLFALPDQIGHALDLAMGGSIRLRGFDLVDGLEEGAERRPGEAVGVRLYWQAEGPTDVSYTVFVQLIGPDGRAHGQVDHVPAAGSAPTTSWAPGQVIVDEVSVAINEDAPAGDYVIAVGLYHADSGDRLPVTDNSGKPYPGQQVVLAVGFIVVNGES